MSDTRPQRAIDAVLSKRYGHKVALDDATLQVQLGTVHGVVGENGAGKSTMLKIVAGVVGAEQGKLEVLGQTLAVGQHSPGRAQELGLGMVHQHGLLVPNLTVVENAILGRETLTERGGARRLGWLDLKTPAAQLSRVGTELDLRVDPWARVEDLGVADRQRAEIVSVVALGARLVILDEPTAILAPPEVAGLMAALRRLRASGKTVVLVSHKLDEVVDIADEVTVLRAGKSVKTFAPPLSATAIAAAMIGTAASDGQSDSATGEATGAADRKSAEGHGMALHIGGMRVASAVSDVTLTVRCGEVVGVAGVEGNGQAELALAIAGLISCRGEVRVGDRVVSSMSAGQRQRLGLAHIPADRHVEGLLVGASLVDNVLVGRPDLRRFWRRRRSEESVVGELLRRADVRPPDPTALAGSLSGGNQQKLVVAREMTRPGLRAVVASHPTRGVDLVAAAAIHQRLRRAADGGVGILLISADLEEILGVADRVVVMLRGKIAGEMTVSEARTASGRTVLGEWMTGAAAAEAKAATA